MKLISDLNEWKIHNNSNLGADMPQILSVPSTVISNLARKVTNQITNQLGSTDSVSSNTNASSAVNASLSQFSDADSLDDSMRKVNKYVRKNGTVTLLCSNFMSFICFACIY